jgi:hypothetical protein
LCCCRSECRKNAILYSDLGFIIAFLPQQICPLKANL